MALAMNPISLFRTNLFEITVLSPFVQEYSLLDGIERVFDDFEDFFLQI